MIHFDPLFYKQTSPKFHLGKRSVLYYLYIKEKTFWCKTCSEHVQKHTKYGWSKFSNYVHEIFSYFFYTFIYIGQNQNSKENFQLEKSLLFRVIKTGNNFCWVYFNC
jgi:hypothetical protein